MAGLKEKPPIPAFQPLFSSIHAKRGRKCRFLGDNRASEI
ncbi:hypothetical protein CPter291_3460 [Collimonas pratensis]|uniref:Uncharacterized protein n=1 Tax=Collimonas pratensis TaxID=279113 RepID=A0ABN4MDM9_9BURK|nr:hypothetical protein CPter291_3460 [Collimonas pratensis]